jgi:hypothetical protein
MQPAPSTYPSKPTYDIHLKPYHRMYNAWYSITGTGTATVLVTEPPPRFRDLAGVGLVSVYTIELHRLPDGHLAALLLSLAFHFNVTIPEVLAELSRAGLPIVAHDSDPPTPHTT